MNNHKSIFTSLYEECAWGNDENPEYKGSSGYGSSLDITKIYLFFLRNFIEMNNIQSVTDLGCGSFQYGEQLYNNIKNLTYIGYDIYEDLILFLNKKYINNNKYSFINLDIFNEMNKIVDSELFIIKDVLQHWSNKEIIKFINFIINNKKFKYLLVTNSCDVQNKIKDIETGKFRPLSITSYPLNEFNLIGLFKFGKNDYSKITDTEIWIQTVLETSIFIK